MIVLTKTQRENALATLKPIEIAQLLYEHCGMDAAQFAESLWDHLNNAFEVSNPRLFDMGRAVILEDGRHAWLVNMLVGQMDEFFRNIPFPLECVAFYRRGDRTKLKIYEYSRFMELVRRTKE